MSLWITSSVAASIERLGEAAVEHLSVHVVDGQDGRQHHVEDEEVALEAIRHVVLSSAGVLHGSHVLQVLTGLEVASLVLVQEVETTPLHEQAHHLEGRLVTPLVDLGHAHVVHEDGHAASSRRAEVLASTLL